jgi:HEAT repeat protein
MKNQGIGRIGIALAALVLTASPAIAAPAAAPAESARMARAKDLIADEEWMRAIQELRAAVADPKEQSKDEALFWLAHSQNQIGDLPASVESIRSLERDHPSSRWVKPARSLLIELAQKLGRDDVLWWTAAHPPRAVRVSPPTPRPAVRPRGKPAPPAPPAEPAVPWPAPEPAPPTAWVWPETFQFDADLRIQALGSLIHSDSERVIPILRNIALEADNPGAARRAVFVLAQSRKPEARSTVVEVAKTGPEPVRIAAVRELGRFGGPDVSQELLLVYSLGNIPVKQQVVTSLGQRAEKTALLRIAQSEQDRGLRERAIVTLGRAGGREQLRVLYATASMEIKRPIIVGLFNARAEDELIRVAEEEKDPALRAQAVSCLRLMGTPKARKYLETVKR